MFKEGEIKKEALDFLGIKKPNIKV